MPLIGSFANDFCCCLKPSFYLSAKFDMLILNSFWVALCQTLHLKSILRLLDSFSVFWTIFFHQNLPTFRILISYICFALSLIALEVNQWSLAYWFSTECEAWSTKQFTQNQNEEGFAIFCVLNVLFFSKKFPIIWIKQIVYISLILPKCSISQLMTL